MTESCIASPIKVSRAPTVPSTQLHDSILNQGNGLQVPQRPVTSSHWQDCGALLLPSWLCKIVARCCCCLILSWPRNNTFPIKSLRRPKKIFHQTQTMMEIGALVVLFSEKRVNNVKVFVQGCRLFVDEYTSLSPKTSTISHPWMFHM